MVAKSELIARLQTLADEMRELGTAIDYYGGLADWAAHGAQLVGAAAIIETWVVGMAEVLADPVPTGEAQAGQGEVTA